MTALQRGFTTFAASIIIGNKVSQRGNQSGIGPRQNVRYRAGFQKLLPETHGFAFRV